MDSLESHASVVNSCHVRSEVGKSHARSLQFHPVCPYGVSRSPAHPRDVVLLTHLRQNINALSRGSYSTPQFLVPAWPRYPVLLVVRGWHRGLSPHPIQRVNRLRDNPELGYSAHLPSWLSLSSANLHYRENFSQSTHEVGMA